MSDAVDTQFQAIKDDIQEIKARMKEFEVELDNKVSFKVFTWVLGILLVLVVGVQGVIYSKLETTGEKVSQTKEDVALIKFRLDSAK